MSDSLSVAILAGLGGMIGWGAADFFAKKTIDRIGDIPTLVWAHIFGSLIFVITGAYCFLVSSSSVHIPTDFSTWLGLAFFGALQMVVYFLLYRGFSKGKLSLLNPVFASYSGFVALISIVFLAESVSSLVVAGLIAIFGGIILLNVDTSGLSGKRINIIPGLKEVGLAALLAAGWTLGWDKFISGQNFLAYALLMYVFMTSAALLLARIQKVELLNVPSSLWRPLALIGFGEFVAYVSISLGYSQTSYTSVVALISGAFSVPTVILARLFLKERISSAQALAIGIIVAGIILVALR